MNTALGDLLHIGGMIALASAALVVAGVHTTPPKQEMLILITASEPVNNTKVYEALRRAGFPVTGILNEPLELTEVGGKFFLGSHFKAAVQHGTAQRHPVTLITEGFNNANQSKGGSALHIE